MIGSEYPQVITDDGKISAYNMYDYKSMEIMLQVVNKEDETDVAKKAFQVAVPRKTQKQKMLTWQMWIKVLIASVPAGIVGVLFNDYLDAVFYKPLPVAVMLIVYGVLFIVVGK